MPRITALLVVALVAAAPLNAQDTTQAVPIRATLTLSEALSQAQANSPAYRQVLNDAGPARWGVRQAYSQLFLPSADVSLGLGYNGAGSSTFGGTEFRQSSPSYNSNYDISLGWRLSGQTLTAPARAKALQRATGEQIAAGGVSLKADVTTQYLIALQAAAQVDVAEQQVKRNDDFLRLAQARYQVGQTTLLDVRQAEVTKSTSEVALLRARQTVNEAKLELFRLMGIEPPAPVAQIALTDSFPVTEPQFDLPSLLATAEQQNPNLRALRAQEDAAGAAVTAAKSQYLPSLSLNAGWSGFTQEFSNENLLLNQQLAGAQAGYQSCLDNNQIRTSAGLPLVTTDCLSASGLQDAGTLDPAAVAAFHDRNNVFPFSFSRQPFRANLSISLPIFNGFSRELDVSQQQAQREDAQEQVRANRLLVRKTVEADYLGVETAYSSIAVQQAARDAARDQLRLAQDRYRLGSGTALELSDAQNAVQGAEGAYVNAVYGYHIAVAALEAAVGRPLR
ncbi:MAG TPA: TolC family protein [Gemmatimonadales bacterium]|jgi:outer membrane protein|nr:TolC family protein [Gemmatimonadales bacterium]